MKLARSISRLEFIYYRYNRVAHGLRIACAFTLSFLLIRLLALPDASWPLITLIVVMGSVSDWGNVLPRAVQRIVGTLFGSLSGLIALKIELYSTNLMLLWCAMVLFIASYFALGKRPYTALMTAITLSVVVGSPAGDFDTALWRSADVIFGCVLALIFTAIFAQSAYTFWRIRLADCLLQIQKIYHSGLSANLLEKPRLQGALQQLLASVVKMRASLEPAHKESGIPKSVFEGIQTIERNLITIIQMLINAWWGSRDSHLLLLNAPTLRCNQQMTEIMLKNLSDLLIDGHIERIETTGSKLEEMTLELKQLLAQAEHQHAEPATVFGYVWLSIEINRQLEALRDLIRLVLRH